MQLARNHRLIPFPPKEVFAVLEDAERYGEWVVGARRTADTDPRWPEPGSRFSHQQGIGPLHITDVTTVRTIERGRRIELEALVRPLLTARVAITVQPVAGGSLVTMEEEPTGGLLAPLTPFANWLLRRRNREALRRLELNVAEVAGS